MSLHAEGKAVPPGELAFPMSIRSKPSKGTVLAILMAMSVLTTLLGPRLASMLRRPAQLVLAPLSDGGMFLAIKAKTAMKSLTAGEISQAEADRLQKDNQALAAQVSALNGELHRVQDEVAKIQNLDTLMFGPTRDIPCELIPAHVIAADALMYGQNRMLSVKAPQSGLAVTTRRLLTDRSKAMYHPGGLSAVALPPQLDAVSSAVLIGRLTETGAYSARLQLVTDRGFKISARIIRVLDPTNPRQVSDDGRARRLLTAEYNPPLDVENVQGDGGELLNIPDISDLKGVRKGDLLVTRNDDSLLPAQVRIGEVVNVKEGPKQAGFVTVQVRPSVDLETVRDVYVVVPRIDRLEPKGGPKR